MRSPIKNLKKKTNSLSTLRELIPKGSVVQTYPFYDGAIEFSLAEADRYTVGCTTSPVVYEFWEYAMQDPKKISLIADKMFPVVNENTFDILKSSWYSYKDPFVRSALFFLLNRCSSVGMISHGNLDTKNYNPISLNELRTFKIDNFHSVFIKPDTQYTMAKDTDFNLFSGGNYYYDLLSTEQIVGIEESPFQHSQMLSDFKDKPSIFVYGYHPRLGKLKGWQKIFLDQYGRLTAEDNAKEIILHNV
jgi:hypothetical protein